MFAAEYVRNLNCNYERILLEKKPEENRYQYCIVGRGGIKRLLSCSLRYINGKAYLYYDISSTQSLSQLYAGRIVKRDWLKNFLWSMKQVRRELERFLLDDDNLIWYPEHIFQDLEKKDFSYMYIPYYEGECGFKELLDFLVERIDYEDECLVECVYTMHEQYGLLGKVYIQEQIFEDAKRLEETKIGEDLKREKVREIRVAQESRGQQESREPQEFREPQESRELQGSQEPQKPISEGALTEEEPAKKGILYFLGGKRRRQQEEREQLRNQNQQRMSSFAVAEDTHYTAQTFLEREEEEEEYGRTVYVEEKEEVKLHKLYTPEGRVLYTLDKANVLIGKKKGEADLVLEDSSVSRLHARIAEEGGEYYLEDLNSTNGTFKNGLRMQPYEKRNLQSEDEIRLGKIQVIFR